MPTPVSHLAVGYAIASWARPATPVRRLGIVAAACAALPDIDWPWGLPTTSLFSHRAITHSLLFALIAAALATWVCFSREARAADGRTILLVALLAAVSHACLDALTTYSYGIEFFAPFTQQRFRFLWTPLGSSDGGLGGQLRQEAIVVLLPALALAWLGRRLEHDHTRPPRHAGLGL